MPYQWHSEDTVDVETPLIWKAIPDDVNSSFCQGAERTPRAPQLGQGPRRLSWALPDSVGQKKTEEMLTLSHVGLPSPRVWAGDPALAWGQWCPWAGLLGLDDGSLQ